MAALKQHFGSRADDLVAAIGSSIGTCCGEMGEEVLSAKTVDLGSEQMAEARLAQSHSVRGDLD